MKTAKISLKGKSGSPLSQSRFYEPDVPRLANEKHDSYEKRTWMHRLHVGSDGRVFIPGMSIKIALTDAARHLGKKFQGNVKFGSRFIPGIMCTENLGLQVLATDVPGEWLHVPSDGKTGGSKRVLKRFPRIDHWEGSTSVDVLDEAITKEVFEEHLIHAGNFVGLGRFRPARGGYFGRFDVVSIEWR